MVMNVDRETARIVRAMKRLGLEPEHIEATIKQRLSQGARPKFIEKSLRKLVREKTGLIQRRKSRELGVWVSVYDAEPGGFCADGGAYVTLCEEHGTICNHDTIKLALDHAPYVEWCEECQAPEPIPHPTLIEKIRGWANPEAFCISLKPEEADEYVKIGVLEQMNGRLCDFETGEPTARQAYRLTKKGWNLARLAGGS